MKEALKEAKKAYLKEEVPVGAVVVYNGEDYTYVNFNVIGFAWFDMFKTQVCHDYDNDYCLYLEQDASSMLIYNIGQSFSVTDYDGAYYRVYELPFSL